MTNPVPDFLADALASVSEQEASPVSDGQRLREMCALLVRQASAVESAELALAEAKALLLRTQRTDLPELMKEFGTTSITLDDGSKVELKDEVDARIREEFRADAHAYLIGHGYAGLIKTEVVVEFERGSYDAASALAESLRAEHEHVNLEQVVHPATLKSWVKERREAGEALPEDVFGIAPYTFAKLVPPKRPRSKVCPHLGVGAALDSATI